MNANTPSSPIVVAIRHESDVVMARNAVRTLARAARLSEAQREALATATTEIARNILVHARFGEVRVELAAAARGSGVVVTAHDEGPGIADVERALTDGYSTGHGLGLGLPGARRLVDEFEVVSTVGSGTSVVLKMWSTERGIPGWNRGSR